MKPKDQRTPNLALRQQRMMRGWSLQRVVEAICALPEQDGRVPGVSAAMVSCWEMGKKKPSPFYQERLCLIYGLSADRLGFMDAPVVPYSSSSNGVKTIPAMRTVNYHVQPVQPVQLPSIPMPVLTTSLVLHEQIRAVDLLSDGTQHTPDEQLGAWLTLGAHHLSMLLDAGWSSKQVFDALQVVLQGVQGLPRITRRKLLEMGAAALVSEIPLSLQGQVTESERLHLTEALGKSIGDGWKMFHTMENGQALLVSNTLLYLVKQNHYFIYPNLLPLFYSGVYRLNGAAHYFQGQYDNAWKALEQSYLAALDNVDTWNMGQSRSWQAYIWNDKRRYVESLQATQAALRLIDQQDDTENIRLRARLLTFSARNSAALGNSEDVQESLNASKALLGYLSFPHEEFDESSWLQEAGICALKLGQYELAANQLQLALAIIPRQWTLRYISISISLAITQVRLKQRENALATMQQSLPVVKAVRSVKLTQEFIYCLQAELAAAFPHDNSCQTFVAEAQGVLSGC